MGLAIGFSSSSADKNNTVYVNRTINKKIYINKPRKGNPNPSNYQIIRYKQIDKNLLIELKYLDCTNFEGRKILVFNNITLKQLLKQKLIDPHFSKSTKYRHPFARLIPNKQGWKLGIKICQEI